MLSRLRHEEQGIAMITAILVSAVVLILSIAVVQLSIHNSDASAYDRNRVQSIHAAEAGLDYYFSLLSATGGQSPPCSLTRPLAGSPGTFTVTPVFYDATGSPLACPLPGGSVPASVLLSSSGRSTSGQPRTMQAFAKLTVGQGSTFDNAGAIFGNSSVFFTSNAKVGGAQYSDADVYTNGPVTLAANSTLYGRVYAQGPITLGSNSEAKKDVWAAGDITMTAGSRIGGTATSTGSIALANNARVFGDAKATGTVNGGTVDGARSPGTAGITAPPPRAYPVFTFNAADWGAAGFTNQQTFSGATACTAAETYIRSGWTGGKLLVRITDPTCTLRFPANTQYSVREELAIVSQGSVFFETNARFSVAPGSPPGSAFNVFVFAGLGGAPGCNLTFDPNSGFNPGLAAMLYTPAACTITLRSNSAISEGQIFGGTVNFHHTASFRYKSVSVPGTGIGGYKQDIQYKREVVT